MLKLPKASRVVFARLTCSYNNHVDLLHGDCVVAGNSRAKEKQQTRGKGRNDLCAPTENDVQKCDCLPWAPFICGPPVAGTTA